MWEGLGLNGFKWVQGVGNPFQCVSGTHHLSLRASIRSEEFVYPC